MLSAGSGSDAGEDGSGGGGSSDDGKLCVPSADNNNIEYFGCATCKMINYYYQKRWVSRMILVAM